MHPEGEAEFVGRIGIDRATVTPTVCSMIWLSNPDPFGTSGATRLPIFGSR
ncbi:hypothetical protein [Paracidovorax citrulli]